MSQIIKARIIRYTCFLKIFLTLRREKDRFVIPQIYYDTFLTDEKLCVNLISSADFLLYH
jgi:hypothetical protein